MSSLFAHQVDVAPEPGRIAARLASHEGAFWLNSSTSPCQSYLGAYPTCVRDGWDPEPELAALSGGPLSAVPRWIGLLPYEACRGLEGLETGRVDQRPPALVRACRWWRYPAVVVVDHAVRVVGEDPDSVARIARILKEEPREDRASLVSVREVDAELEHRSRIEEVREAIAEGRTYQVNLARRFEVQTTGSALGLLALLSDRCRAPFGFGLACAGEGLKIAGVSPELCLSLRADGTLMTRPIKGTSPRGATWDEDRAFSETLSADPKERAELSMVVDLERNDLSRVAKVGSVRVLSPGTLETFDGLHHRTATVTASLREGVTRSELLRAFLPSGSVTGTPKIAAMRLIARLESARRGLYAGAYGYLAHDGSLRLGMAIRTLVVAEGDRGEYFAGGGIVADSVPSREVAETGWKSRVIVGPAEVPSGPGVVRPSDWNSEGTAENWACFPDSGSERNSTHGS